MELKELKPRKALNKAFLKVKPNRLEIETFKANLIALLDSTNDTESEEFHKNLVIDFLKKTYYDPNHFVNTKGRNDLVIHNGNNAKSSVGVIIEAKKPTNRSEMITTKKLNTKAFQELVLYYLRERITHKNLEVKYLIVTNINEWFIFDATLFDRLFAQNKNLLKQFNDFEGGRLADIKTDFFYKQIAEPFIAGITAEIEFTYFNIQDYQKPLRNTDKGDDNSLIALFKLLSPEHLLKLPLTNDSNSLDKGFYTELLHIIGLTETKDQSKKLISRNPDGQRLTGTIIEDAIIQLDSHDKISRIDNSSLFGDTYQDKLFNVALELTITWINRILFLKLLEGQLITYHKGDKSYAFLNSQMLREYDDVDRLFFQVLAKPQSERNDDVKEKFLKVPYLNSSLFESTELEHQTITIDNLKDDKTIPIHSQTILKDQKGKKLTGNLPALEYLIRFLDSYDFSSEGSEEIQEDNKTLINASVLGLIFEKINGYKDGSFFTPGFITMYMCRQLVRNTVLQKFNEHKGWSCNSFEDLYNAIEDRDEANTIINSVKICDPSVGSGHFLVSVLNELISVKNDLKILQDRNGKRLKEYQVEVINDELVITDEEGELFEYNPTNKESQRIQETLFHEKQTIIENCLFGVDINPNSVKICRLRLWIELLKNAYYKNETELETLPNIDINIKCGNSLISRFSLSDDLGQALQKSKWSIENYRLAVETYRHAKTKEEKREMEKLISDIKSDFRMNIDNPFKKRISSARGTVDKVATEINTKKQWGEKVNRSLHQEYEKAKIRLKKLETERDDIESNKIFKNAFEWRFEFPEVLDENGQFIGFDLVIGNPPYAVVEKERNTPLEPYKTILDYSGMSKRYTVVEGGKQNLYRLFIKLGFDISRDKARFGFIIPLTLMGDNSLFSTRQFIFKNFDQLHFHCFPQKDNASLRVFEDAKQSTLILLAQVVKSDSSGDGTEKLINVNTYPFKSFEDKHKSFCTTITELYNFDNYRLCIPLVSETEWNLLNKIHKAPPLRSISAIQIRRGEINQTVFRKYITSESTNARLLKGVEVGQYRENEKLSQGQREFLNEQAFFADSKNNDQANLRRIATQRITGVDERLRIVATIIEPRVHFADSTNSISVEPPISLEYVLGLLNSKLYQWRFKTTSSNNNVSTTELESLPFPENETVSMQIEQRVKELLELNKKSTTADKTSMEDQINKLVYQLYELTEDEIKLIES